MKTQTRYVFIGLLVAMSCALATSSWADGEASLQNLLPNPGFEDGQGTYPEGWSGNFYSKNQNGKITWTDKTAHNGKKSIKMDAFEENVFGQFSTRDYMPVEAGKHYLVNVWFKEKTRCFQVQVRWYDAKQNQILSQSITPDPEDADKWVSLDEAKLSLYDQGTPVEGKKDKPYELIAPPGSSKAIVFLLLITPGEVYCDDVMFAPVDLQKNRK